MPLGNIEWQYRSNLSNRVFLYKRTNSVANQIYRLDDDHPIDLDVVAREGAVGKGGDYSSPKAGG